jgi:NAD(P)-dependent dehydrogenase (short-subunit alcohol dehydrogenase family)
MEQTPGPAQRLLGKVALVTGAAGANSIGRAICLRLAGEGARVAVLDLDGDGAASVAVEIKATGGEAVGLACDVAQLDEVVAATERLSEMWSAGIDILVNGAAIYGAIGEPRPFDQWRVDEWDAVQSVNVRGMWFCARAVFPHMREKGYGKIVNISSSTFFEGVGGMVHYATSKGAVIAFTRSLARELGGFGIRVNAVAPGFTASGASLTRAAGRPSLWEETRKRQCLSERNATPDDLTGPVLFLASADSDFMTGQTLLVDGGRTMH